MKKNSLLIGAALVAMSASAQVAGYQLHGQITGNSNWESIPLTENNGWYEYTSDSFVPGQFGIKSVNSAGGQIDWIGGTATVSEADVEYNFVGSTNSNSTLTGSYTFGYNPTEQKVRMVTFSGQIETVTTYVVRGQVNSGTDEWTNAPMTEEDGVWSVTKDFYTGNFGLQKLVNGSEKGWYNFSNLGTPADNCETTQNGNINLTVAGNYTITFYPETSVITVKQNGGGDDPDPDPQPGDDVVVYFDNTDTNWAKVCVYAWTGSNENAAWPGAEMVVYKDNIYKATLATAYENVIFNSGSDANKTQDLILVNNHVYTVVGDTQKTIDEYEQGGGDDPVNPDPEYTYVLWGSFNDVEGTNWAGVDLTENEGKWTANNVESKGTTEFGIQVFNLDGEQKGWIAAVQNNYEITEAGVYNCTSEGCKNFSLAAGTWSFSFDPTAMTLTVTGEQGGGDDPINPGEDKVVYFDNASSNWVAVYVYSWNSVTNAENAAWPGVAMELYNGNIYKATLSADFNQVIFNNNLGGDDNKTRDLDLVNNHVYTVTGDTGKTIDEYEQGGDEPIDYSSWWVNCPGQFNNWALNGVHPTAEGVATFDKLAIGTGEFEIKLNNGSEDIYYGSTTPIVENEPTVLTQGGGLHMTISGATEGAEYKVTFDIPSHTITVKGVSSGVETVAAENGEAVYFNLQGQRVANPENGLFIRVQNGKAVKVVK